MATNYNEYQGSTESTCQVAGWVNRYAKDAGLSFGNSELYEHVGKDKTCAYCGNVNAPDARNCRGCQHAI